MKMGVKYIIRLIAIALVFCLFINTIKIVSAYYSGVPHWLREGAYAIYKIEHISEIMFLNGTWMDFCPPTRSGYLKWSVDKVVGDYAHITVELHIELNNTKVVEYRGFKVPLQEVGSRLIKSGVINLKANVKVNVKTRDVYLNGVKVGKTGFWLPLGSLYNGSSIRPGEVFNHPQVRVVLRGPISLKYGDEGWFYVYTPEIDPNDSMYVLCIHVNMVNATLGYKQKFEGYDFEVVNVTYVPERNVTIVAVRWYFEKDAITIIGTELKGNYENKPFNWEFIIKNIRGPSGRYYYDPTSGLALIAEIGRAGEICVGGDGLTAGLGLRVFDGVLILSSTNIPLIQNEIFQFAVISGAIIATIIIDRRITVRRSVN